MGRQEKIGWAIALICSVGWWVSPAKFPTKPSSSSITAPWAAQAPRSDSTRPSNTSIAEKSPDINRPKVQWLYTNAEVRVRAAPDPSAPAQEVLAMGELIQTNYWVNGWYNVTVSARIGWIQRNYLTAVKPASLPSNVSSSQFPKSALKAKRKSLKGYPVRDPYVGKCDCPYDLMADGTLCGGNSAYSGSGDSSGCYWE